MHRATLHRGPIAISLALAAAISVGVWPTAPSTAIAAPGDPILDVELDVASVVVGATVQLTATIHGADGSLLTGPSTNTQVRFDFLPGSANAPVGGGGADMRCHTGLVGTCTVSYVAAAVGTDVICARTTNGSDTCLEDVAAPERVDAFDTVQRTVVAADPTPAPDADPTPAPDADPTPAPDADPTPAPDADPTPAPDADPTPAPDADPTPAPDADPTPAPDADPTPAPDADPTPAPDADPTPAPDADPTPAPDADPTPAPDADPTPAPDADPTPAPDADPTPAPDADPTPAPDADPTPAPDADPTPAPDADPTPAPDADPTPAPDADPTPAPDADPTPAPDGSQDPKTALVLPVGEGGPSGPRSSGDGPAGPRSDSMVGPAPGLQPDGPSSALGIALEGAARLFRPEVAATVATVFGFPILLALLVLLFLLVQSRVDHRDPKLRAAPLTLADTLVPFADDAP